ncbi:hypothetical protein IH781_00215 [Patescibacteria group bacterium]|nr:hypothetical protein [Patescibacteria group bacterium]
MKTDHLAFRILVWNMRWMTLHVGFVARPFIVWYSEREVIACGLRATGGDVRIIYSMLPSRCQHTFTKRDTTGQWLPGRAEPTANFSGELVHQVTLPNAQLGDIYRVNAELKNSGRLIQSPTITVKPATARTNILTVQMLPHGQAKFMWPAGEQFDPMVYFLALEDNAGNSLAGVYTRDTSWTYPITKQASLSLGPIDPSPLEPRQSYTAKLVIVDFDGWVSNIAERQFTLLP